MPHQSLRCMSPVAIVYIRWKTHPPCSDLIHEFIHPRFGSSSIVVGLGLFLFFQHHRYKLNILASASCVHGFICSAITTMMLHYCRRTEWLFFPPATLLTLKANRALPPLPNLLTHPSPEITFNFVRYAKILVRACTSTRTKRSWETSTMYYASWLTVSSAVTSAAPR